MSNMTVDLAYEFAELCNYNIRNVFNNLKEIFRANLIQDNGAFHYSHYIITAIRITVKKNKNI